jgi:hypothetical protein
MLNTLSCSSAEVFLQLHEICLQWMEECG